MNDSANDILDRLERDPVWSFSHRGTWEQDDPYSKRMADAAAEIRHLRKRIEELEAALGFRTQRDRRQ